MNSDLGRRGHAAIGAIIEDMEPYLPSETINKPGYRQCRTTFGLLTTMYKRAQTSDQPEKEYKEIQQLEHDLRRRLNGLNPDKEIPEQMAELLDELKTAVEAALSGGVTTEFVIQGMRDILEGKPGSLPAPRPDKVKWVPETRLKKVKEQLAEANKKITRLNEENNMLALKVKRLEMRRGQATPWGKTNYWSEEEEFYDCDY